VDSCPNSNNFFVDNRENDQVEYVCMDEMNCSEHPNYNLVSYAMEPNPLFGELGLQRCYNSCPSHSIYLGSDDNGSFCSELCPPPDFAYLQDNTLPDGQQEICSEQCTIPTAPYSLINGQSKYEYTNN
jgi:hypothetical protein